MKGWRLVVLLCTALLCEPVRPQEKWSKPETAQKRIDDWVPITATCPSCQTNLEPNESSGIDEIGSLLNPPAIPSGRAFNFNGKQNNFNRITAGEPYEVTTPQPQSSSGQFFNQQQAPKIPQPVHFPVPFFGQQNPFQTRFSGLPDFQPQFTFVPQPQTQIQHSPKEKKVTFPETPFIQQQNKGSVQLVYVPIEALQRQKPRFQTDRPIPQQSQLDVKTQSPFETGKLKFQRPPQPFEPPRFLTPQQFEQESNRFAPPPASFEQNTGRFPSTPQLFEQGKPNFKEQRPEFLPQNEQPAVPQSYQFVEDARNPSSTFFQFHNRFQKPSFEESKPKDLKPQSQQAFVPNFDASRQESTQNVVSNFEANRPRPESSQKIPPNFQETKPKQELRPQNNGQSNFQETRPRQESLPKFVPKFEEPKLGPEQFIAPFQENRPSQEEQQQPLQFISKFEEPKLEPQQQFISNFPENRPRQQQKLPPPPLQFVPKFEEPKLESQEQFIPNFQENRPRQEQQPQPPQFIPKFEEPKLELQQQFSPKFQENRPRQEQQPQPPQFIPKFEEPKLEPQQQFIPNFQENRPRQEQQPQTPQFVPKFEEPKLEPQQQFIPNFQEILQQQTPQQTFTPSFESLRPSSTPVPQQTFDLPSSTEQIVQTLSTPYPPPHQPPLSVYMEKRLDNRINEVLTILKDAKTIPVLDTIGNHSPKVFVGPSDLDAPRGYVKFELPYLSSLDITKIDSMADRLPFFVAPLNFKPPFGYAKIPFPPPHIGSVVVSSKSPAVATSTEFVPFALTSQLPTEINSLQPSLFSTTQRQTEKAQPSTESIITTTKRNRQRKPLHRGSLTSFSTTTPVSDITERKNDQFTTPAELQRLPENSSNNQQQFLETTTAGRQQFSQKPVEQQTAFETTQAPIQQQQSFIENTPSPVRPKFLRKPVEQQTVFETTQQPQQLFENPQQQFFSNQQIPQNQQDYIDSLSPLTQQQFFNNQQQPSQQTFFDNQQQFLDNPPQAIQEQILNTPQPSADINNQDINQQQFISSSTEKQIKNFQQIQPLSQYHVGNNFLNQQQSSTQQIQSTSSIPQTVANEPETEATVAPTDTSRLRQRLSYYDKLQLSSTEASVETTRAENVVEPSEKPRERPKLRPRQRLTTTRKPTTESLTSEVVPEQVSETSTQRFNPLKRRRPTTTTTTEQTETTRSSLRSRTTQASRSEFVRSRSRRPTSTTTTTTTTEATRTEQAGDINDVQASNVQDEQKKIEEAASFWNEPVTIQQSHSYELDPANTHSSTANVDGKFGSAEPPASTDYAKEKYGNEKKAHDPSNEKKTPGRRGHWVRVRVKKPQDGLDTAESQNSLGPLSANAIRELATKPTTEFGAQPSSSVPAETATTATEKSVTVTPTQTSSTTEVVTTTTTTTTTTPSTATTTTTVSPPTTASEYTEGVTEERPAETTDVTPSASANKTYPDDEQDEAFQRNLADMLAKFIGGGNEPQQQQQQKQQQEDREEQQQQQQEQEEQQQQQQQQETTVTAAEESTAETQYVGSDAEPTVTLPAVTEVPIVPVTSTMTKVSMETEICYRGRCVKSKKNKQTTDSVSEP